MDKDNKVIQLVPTIFYVTPASENSKKLEKDEKIELNLKVLSIVIDDVSIEDVTFALKKEDGNSIKLKSCSKIPQCLEIKTIKITCEVENEIKDGSYSLELIEGKKIDTFTPIVTGNISFKTSSKSSLSQLFRQVTNYIV